MLIKEFRGTVLVLGIPCSMNLATFLIRQYPTTTVDYIQREKGVPRDDPEQTTSSSSLNPLSWPLTPAKPSVSRSSTLISLLDARDFGPIELHPLSLRPLMRLSTGPSRGNLSRPSVNHHIE